MYVLDGSGGGDKDGSEPRPVLLFRSDDYKWHLSSVSDHLVACGLAADDGRVDWQKREDGETAVRNYLASIAS